MDKDDYHYKLKIVVCGEAHCGKTAFLDSKFFNKQLQI